APAPATERGRTKPWCEAKAKAMAAAATALVMAAKLKSAWMKLVRPLAAGIDCTRLARAAIANDSLTLSPTATISRKGTLTDMVPLMPGSFTLSREAIKVMIRRANSSTGLLDFQ